MRYLKNELKIIGKFLWLFLVFSFIEFHPSIKNLNEQSNFSSSVQSPQISGSKIAIVGDLQKTSIWEIALGRESNDEERVLLIKEVAKENPAMLLVLGDMVFDGSDERQWREFDNLLKPLKEINTPIFPVLGNHDYWGINSRAIRNFTKRFSQFSNSRWYVQKHDSLALIFLDSNKPDLTAAKWNEQKKWFDAKVNEFDSDNSIKGILVFLHHPAYTNSLVTGDEMHVQETFVPPFLKSKKSLAMISGHAHTYERFMNDGKMFIVSGGGGGPRVGLRDGIDFHKDLYTGSSPRPFHYLLIERDEIGVKITVRGLLKSTNLFFTMEEFYLKLKD